MLVFTNRNMTQDAGEKAYAPSFKPGGTRLAVASVSKTASGWAVRDRDDDVSEADARDLLIPLLQGGKPLLVYVHGNNNSPGTCFRRCQDLGGLYPGVEIVGFSWPSEGYLSDGSPLPEVPMPAGGDEADLAKVNKENRTTESIQHKIRRYHQAQTNAKDSMDAFARFLRLVGTARLQANGQPFTLAVHSLGNQLFQYALDVPGAGEAVATAHNVVLLAPCVRAAGHTEWLAKVRPKGRTYVTYNKGDNVLFGAYIADGQQTKLGTEPGEILHADGVRYVSFSNASTGFGGHGYFVKGVTKAAKKLFTRLFTSAVDIEPGELPKKVYPIGCDPDGAVCYMAVPDQPDLLP